MEERETQPQDPITALAAASAQVHELYRAYHGAGFDAQQALYLVGCVLTRHPGYPPTGGGGKKDDG